MTESIQRRLNMRKLITDWLWVFTFVVLLFRLVIPSIRLERRVPESQEPDKYERILGHPSHPLVTPDEIKFCPVCHIAVAGVKHTKHGTQIIQNGHVAINMGRVTVITAKGDRVKGFATQCRNGHQVVIKEEP